MQAPLPIQFQLGDPRVSTHINKITFDPWGAPILKIGGERYKLTIQGRSAKELQTMPNSAWGDLAQRIDEILTAKGILPRHANNLENLRIDQDGVKFPGNHGSIAHNDGADTSAIYRDMVTIVNTRIGSAPIAGAPVQNPAANRLANAPAPGPVANAQAPAPQQPVVPPQAPEETFGLGADIVDRIRGEVLDKIDEAKNKAGNDPVVLGKTLASNAFRTAILTFLQKGFESGQTFAKIDATQKTDNYTGNRTRYVNSILQREAYQPLEQHLVNVINKLIKGKVINWEKLNDLNPLVRMIYPEVLQEIDPATLDLGNEEGQNALRDKLGQEFQMASLATRIQQILKEQQDHHLANPPGYLAKMGNIMGFFGDQVKDNALKPVWNKSINALRSAKSWVTGLPA